MPPCRGLGVLFRLCLLFAFLKEGAGQAGINPSNYKSYNKNYMKMAIIVWKDDIGNDAQGDCRGFANSLYKPPPSGFGLLSDSDKPEFYTNITVGWETCTMEFKSLWYEAARLMIDPDVNQRSPSDQSSTPSNHVLANQLRDVFCAPIVSLPYNSDPFKGVSAQSFIFDSFTTGDLPKDITLGIDPTFPLPATGIYPINIDASPEQFNITGQIAQAYGYAYTPDDEVKASCFNVSYGPRKKLFQVLVWEGPSKSGMAGEELFSIAGTPPRFKCNCSTDCGATPLYPRVCAGAAVARDIITGGRSNGIGLCNVKTALGDCYSNADCQTDPSGLIQVKRYCAQLFHKTREEKYKEKKSGSCFPCPIFQSDASGSVTCYGGLSVERYPPTSLITSSDFCPNLPGGKRIDSLAPAWCSDSGYCQGLREGVELKYNRNICFNTEDTTTASGLSLDGKLYHCVSPSFPPYLPSRWHWDPALFPKVASDTSLVNNTAFKSTNQNPESQKRTGIFLHGETIPVCPSVLAYFNLVDYTNFGWDQGGNIDIFYPCFTITGVDSFNSSIIRQGNCAEKKFNNTVVGDFWPISIMYQGLNRTTYDGELRDSARYALEQDGGYLYNSHLPYNKAQCTAKQDKFFIFLGTQGYNTKSADFRDVIQTDGYDLITDDVCMFWDKGILPGSNLTMRTQNAGSSNETYYYPERTNGQTFNDDQMKLFLYALNNYVIKNDNGLNLTDSFYGIMNSFHDVSLNECLIPLCKLTNLNTIPALWEPNSAEYAQEVERYDEIENISNAECLASQWSDPLINSFLDGCDNATNPLCHPFQENFDSLSSAKTKCEEINLCTGITSGGLNNSKWQMRIGKTLKEDLYGNATTYNLTKRNAGDVVWLEQEGKCSPRKMSLGLRLQLSLQCVHDFIVKLDDSVNTAAPTVIPISLTGGPMTPEEHSYSFYGKSYSYSKENSTNRLGAVYNHIQDILLHVVPNSNGKSSTLDDKIDHKIMEAHICPQYDKKTSFFFLENIQEIINASSSGQYSAITASKQRQEPGVSAKLVFTDNGNLPANPLSNPPRAYFRSHVLRDLRSISPMIMPQVQASLPTVTFFNSINCDSTFESESYDFAYLCSQMHYDSSLINKAVGGKTNVKAVCDYLYDQVLKNASGSYSFDNASRIVFEASGGANRNNYEIQGHRLTDALIIADAFTRSTVTTLPPRSNGCYSIGTDSSFRLWGRGASTYADQTRERSAEGWTACMNYLEAYATNWFGKKTLFLEDIYKTFPNGSVSEGVCVPCPKFNQSDPTSQKTGKGCGAGNLGYCASGYNCDDTLFCADVIDEGELPGPVLPGVCSNEESCVDRDPLFGTNEKTVYGELGYCAASSQLAVLYFYDALLDLTKSPVCIGSKVNFNDATRVVGPDTNKPYAKLVLPYDCASRERIEEVYNKFTSRIFDVEFNSGGKLEKSGTFLDFYEAMCVIPFDPSTNEIKSVGKDIDAPGTLPKYLSEYLRFKVTGIKPTYVQFGEEYANFVKTGWCLNIRACSDPANCIPDNIGGVQIVPGNQFRIAFQPGVAEEAFANAYDRSKRPYNSSEYARATNPKKYNSFFASYLANAPPYASGTTMVTPNTPLNFWETIQPSTSTNNKLYENIFGSRRTFQPFEGYEDLGLFSDLWGSPPKPSPDSTNDRDNLYANLLLRIQNLAPTAGCSVPRPVYIKSLSKDIITDLEAWEQPNTTSSTDTLDALSDTSVNTIPTNIANLKPDTQNLIYYLTTFLQLDDEQAVYTLILQLKELMRSKKDVPWNLDKLFPMDSGTRVDSSSMAKGFFNAYEQNKKALGLNPSPQSLRTTPPPATLMFPEFCYWTNNKEYTGNFTEASSDQKQMLDKFASTRGFELLGSGGALGDNIIEFMCRPLWEDNFDDDVFWKASMLLDPADDLFSKGEFGFGVDNTVSENNSTALNNNQKWLQALEIPFELTRSYESTYFLSAVSNILGDYVNTFAPCAHKFLGLNQGTGGFVNSNLNTFLNQAKYALQMQNQYPNWNSMCFNNIGSDDIVERSVYGGQISIFSSYYYTDSTNYKDYAAFQESEYLGGFSCKKADLEMPSLFRNKEGGLNLLPAFPGNCFCSEEQEKEKSAGCLGYLPAPGPDCDALPYPTLPPTPPPPTKKPTTPAPTAKPTTLGQLIEQEDEQTEREIGILAAAFFGAVFVLTLLVAVLAFVLKSTKSKTEIELNVAYVDQFYKEKQRQKNLLRRFRPFKFNARRRNNMQISSNVNSSADSQKKLKF